MTLKFYKMAETELGHIVFSANELSFAVREVKDGIYNGPALQKFIKQYFWQALEKIQNVEECWQAIEAVSDEEKKLMEVITNYTSSSYKHIKLVEKTMGPDSFKLKFNTAIKPEKYAEHVLQTYGVSPTPENRQRLIDARTYVIDPALSQDEVVLQSLCLQQNLVTDFVKLSKASLKTSGIRLARYALVLDLLERNPEELVKTAFPHESLEEVDTRIWNGIHLEAKRVFLMLHELANRLEYANATIKTGLESSFGLN